MFFLAGPPQAFGKLQGLLVLPKALRWGPLQSSAQQGQINPQRFGATQGPLIVHDGDSIMPYVPFPEAGTETLCLTR